MAFFLASAVVGLLILLLLVSFVMMAVRRGPRVQRPSCGKCGYAVEGLEALRCPECGSDLRTVGILTSRMRRTLGPVATAVISALLWTILLPILGIIISGIIVGNLPMYVTRTATTTYSLQPVGSFSGIEVQTSQREGKTPHASTATARLLFADGTSSQPLVVDLMEGEVESSPADLPGSPHFSIRSVEAWMASQGAEPIALSIPSDAEQIFTLIGQGARADSVGTPPLFRHASGSSSYSEGGPAWFAPVSLSFWTVVWILGIAVIRRRGRDRA